MFLLSDAERAYIQAGADEGVRGDGRAAFDVRPVSLETGVLPNASGSARVRIGTVTDILVGVKAEVSEPSPQAADEGVVSFSVECSSLASPDFVGRGAADLNAQLVQFLHRLYASHATRRLRAALCIIPGRKCWRLHADALVLDSGGNLFGALSLAVRAALCVVALPRVVVVEGEADDLDDIEVDEENFSLISNARVAPVAVTLSAVGVRGACLADCTSEEEACARFAVTVGVNVDGRVCGAVSGGTAGVDVDRLSVMLKDAATIGVDMLHTTDSFLADDIRRRMLMHEDPTQPVGFFA